MAATSLLALIDDIAMLLDDVATMTKVAARQSAASADDVAAMTQLAAKKTAGVLGDDLALNAQQVTGVKADRELPVVWAVAKGTGTAHPRGLSRLARARTHADGPSDRLGDHLWLTRSLLFLVTGWISTRTPRGRVSIKFSCQE
jgi:hypothetical protein